MCSTNDGVTLDMSKIHPPGNKLNFSCLPIPWPPLTPPPKTMLELSRPAATEFFSDLAPEAPATLYKWGGGEKIRKKLKLSLLPGWRSQNII